MRRDRRLRPGHGRSAHPPGGLFSRRYGRGGPYLAVSTWRRRRLCPGRGHVVPHGLSLRRHRCGGPCLAVCPRRHRLCAVHPVHTPRHILHRRLHGPNRGLSRARGSGARPCRVRHSMVPRLGGPLPLKGEPRLIPHGLHRFIRVVLRRSKAMAACGRLILPWRLFRFPARLHGRHLLLLRCLAADASDIRAQLR